MKGRLIGAHRLLMRYGATLLSVSAAVVVCKLAEGHFGYEMPLILLFPAVIGSIRLGGSGPGRLAIALCILAGAWCLRADGFTTGELLRLGAFAASAMLAGQVVERERNLAENQIRRTDGELREILDHSASAIFVQDLDGRFIVTNPAHADILGTTEKEILGKRDCDFFPPEIADMLWANSKRAIGQGAPIQVEEPLPHRDGARTYSVTRFPLLDDNGRIYAVCGMATDITVQKVADAELRASRERFANAFNYSAIGMAIVSLDARFLQVNRALCRITGYGERELTRLTFENISHPDDLHKDLKLLRRLVAGVIDHYHLEKRYLHKSGHPVWVRLSISSVRDDMGEPIHLVAQIQDISEQKRAIEQLHQSKEAAEAANLAKSEFLANMSHEIRTPLTAMFGYADLLLLPDLTAAERMKHVQVIRRSGEHLLTLINDILDLAKIEAGKTLVEPRDVCLPAFMTEVLSLVQRKAQSKGLELKLSYDPNVPEMIHTDPTRLRQILINLLGNAVKFTETGWVHTHVSAFRGNGEDRLRFAVQDTGIGLTPEQRDALFEAFVQADNSITRTHGGTGLGLAISRRLAKMLGGDVAVDSQFGRGSTFSVTITIEHDAHAAGHAVSRSPQPFASHGASGPKKIKGRVLVVEDGPDNQALIAQLLRRVGCEAEAADSGRVAIARVIGAEHARRPYSLILMDIQMPEMDGLEATRRLRAAGFTGPIVALTANVLESNRDQCIAAGCDYFLTKPIQMDAFYSTISSCLNLTTSTAQASQAAFEISQL